MLSSLREAPHPGGETDADKNTVPTKPLVLVTVIVDVGDCPAFRLSEAGLADRVKSGGGGDTLTIKLVTWERRPLCAVTLTL